MKTNVPSAVIHVATKIRNLGGRAYLVGGAVRDHLLGRMPKDYDMEVYGIPPEWLEPSLRMYGAHRVNVVGQHFGVLKLSLDGLVIDVAYPRTDSKVAAGHTGFSVLADPYMDRRQAVQRRDFTANAILFDPLTGFSYDPAGGIEHLLDRQLVITDPEQFATDPLRVLRAGQFMSRFGFRMDERSASIVTATVPSTVELPGERIGDEWLKLLLSEQPSAGLAFWASVGLFATLHPEVATLAGVPQDPEWHEEGTVDQHTYLTADTAAQYVRDHDCSPEDAKVIVLAAFCHDFGKATTTRLVDGRWTAYSHDAEGVEPARSFLAKLNVDNDTTVRVLKLVEHHMWGWNNTRQDVKVSAGAVRRLARNLAPATIEQLCAVMYADGMGQRTDEIDQLRSMAAAAHLERSTPVDIIQGRDLIGLGMKPSKLFGQIITAANNAHEQADMSREQILAVLSQCSTADQMIALLLTDGQ